ncbi:glycerate kinase [Acuticoccus kandeliae]|uniref:glycerate kinase n=1 Tax=Acuticoccus kandeliae TaxID=2073160 RepID=UPI000D3E0C57|nr:glycerate kinase [Acuticoccus kandeliae]
MHILIACDKFRGSLTAAEANASIAAGLAMSPLEATATTLAIADGGEGTLDALAGGTAERRRTTIRSPFGDPYEGAWLYDPAAKRAVIELAAVAGHAAAAHKGYDPDVASSVGVGELVRAALDAGAGTVVVALGGSITVDGGAGALEALGARYYDASGAPLIHPAGRGLAAIERVDLSGLDPRAAGLSIVLAADVDNPLLGVRGAARVFGPQKGVRAEDIEAFDAALGHFDAKVAEAGRARLADTPFAGAAGGMMVGLAGIAETTARDGFALVAEHHRLEERIAAATLVVTGEGSLDSQSLGGKGPVAIARMAEAAGKPAIAFAGRLAVGPEALVAHGIKAAFSISHGPSSLEDALAGAREALTHTAAHAFATLAIGRALG